MRTASPSVSVANLNAFLPASTFNVRLQDMATDVWLPSAEQSFDCQVEYNNFDADVSIGQATLLLRRSTRKSFNGLSPAPEDLHAHAYLYQHTCSCVLLRHWQRSCAELQEDAGIFSRGRAHCEHLAMLTFRTFLRCAVLSRDV